MKHRRLLKRAALVGVLSVYAWFGASGQNPIPAPFPPIAAGGGGGGSVTAVATGCGTSGGTITTTGTIIAAQPVNPQTGTTYTYLNGDCGKLVTHSNAGAIAATLPQANGSTFKAGWFLDVENLGAGLVTITPTTSTIDGAATITLTTNEGIRITSDGTNYNTVRGKLRTLVSADIPNNAANTSGNAATATALAANPTDCSVANTFANVIAASGNLTCDYERLLSNAQTGTTYTILTGDHSKFITFSNAGAIAVTLPQANGSTFADGFFFLAKNIGAGDVTITPTTSTISGAATIVISNGEFAIVRSDGTNYEAAGIRTIAGSNITLTKARTGVTIAASGGGGTGCVPGGSAGVIQASDGAGACQNTAITDDGTTITSTEPIAAPSVSLGTSPPTCVAGTGGGDCSKEGTVITTCKAAGVDCLYADATQHGFLASFNNGTYLPLVQGPASATVSDLTCWNATNGGLLKDCTALPNGTTATTQSQNDNSTKPATTAYTDLAVANALAAVNPAVAVLAAGTANVVGTYANGAAGIGATFTVTATGAFTLDGISITTVGQRVLLKNQTTGFQNGVYTATIVGVSMVSPVFTRALDYNQPSDINSTGAIPVQSGTVNTTTSWLLTSTVTTVGTDALTYVQFSVNPANQVLAVAPGAGLARFAGSTQTATSAELSGDATTSASNVVAVVKVNGNTPGNTCTNQFERSIDSSARGTCASIAQADLPTITKQRGIGFGWGIGGGAVLTTAQKGYYTWEGGACTISKWGATVDTGTITFDVWKIASGTAIPTVTNTIVASAPPLVSSNTAQNSSTLTGWTTAVTDGDIFGFNISALTGSPTVASVVLLCGQ